MSRELFQRVAERARSDQTRTDQSDISFSVIHPSLTPEDLSESVRQIGFRPAALYVDLLQSVGNGGYGPGYGLLGLVGGATDDQGKTAVGLYNDFRQPDIGDPAWVWPQGLLPICHWGCAIYTCIDCAGEDSQMMTWDPNVWEQGSSPQSSVFPTGMTFAEWLREWTLGTNLWEKMYPTA